MCTSDAAGEIRGAFQCFGDVESVEIIKQVTLRHISANGNKAIAAHEAYVLFKQSFDAYKALKSMFVPKNLMHQVPADTWHQPEYKDISKKPQIHMECNHRCDKEMSKLTCALDELSLRGNEVLCDHTVTEFELELTYGTTLAEVHRTLLNIKPHIGHLKVSLCHGFDRNVEADCVETCDFQRRLMEIIGMNAAGPKLQEMTITGIGGISKMMLDSLAPALKQLEILTIRTNRCNILYLMQTFCPKLEAFHLIGREWDGDGNDAIIQTWPTLTRLVLKSISLDTESDTDSGKRLRRFFVLNPQLDTLELDFMVDNSLLKVIAKGMRELKTLTIDRYVFDGMGAIFNHLVRLKRLESIMVTTCIFKTVHFKSLLACVECFSKMKRLELSTMMQNYVRDDSGNVIMEEFPVKYHHNCSCHDNRTLTFGDRTDPINLPKNKRTLAILVSVARHIKSTDNTLEARILNMFKGAKKFYPDVHKTIVIPEEDRFVFLHVASMQ